MRMYIGGDVCPTPVTAPYFDACDTEALFGTISALTSDADLFAVNLECALTGSDTPIRKCGPNLRGKPEHARVLRELGVTDAGLSNNHVFDFGRKGLTDTLASLDTVGIRYTGVGSCERDARRPHYMRAGGITVALVAVCEHEYSYALPDRAGTWGFDPFETMEDIALARAFSDYVIVFYHGGKEQSVYPSPRLRRACKGMVRAGADLVLCQHSHCVGVTEEYRGAVILYGQGNFNFNGYSDHPHWKTGLLLRLDLSKTDSKLSGAGTLCGTAACGGAETLRKTAALCGTRDDNAAHIEVKIDFHPTAVTATGVTLMEDGEGARFLDQFRARTAVLLDDEKWLSEWRGFCVQSEPGYRRAVEEAFRNGGKTPAQIFPHYLDCEAHTDVWRELYRTWHGENSDENTCE